MRNEVIELLKVHNYFLGLDDQTLQDVLSVGRIDNVPVGGVVHEADQPFSTVGFVLKGRLKAVRVDSKDHEHFFRVLDRGEQFGLMAGALSEPVPLRIVALEPATILSLDYERSMELPLKYPDLRRLWMRTFAQSLQRHMLGKTTHRAPILLAVLHESDATRPLARKLVQRLQEIKEDVAVLSDSDEWRSVPDLKFRSLLDGERALPLEDIRQQIGEWNRVRRILVDIRTSQDADVVLRLLEAADRVLVLARPKDISSTIGRFRTLEVQSRGWRDKIGLVWLLDEGNDLAPAIPELSNYINLDFKISEQSPKAHCGKVLANGLERLVHSLRGVRIGVALGGGAALGMAHLGVLKALEQNGVVIDAIAGTSAGAMTGICYASGMDCDYCASQFASDLKPSWFFRCLPSGNYWYLLYKYRRGRFDPMLRKYLHDWKLEQLPIPCHGVTVDLVSALSVVRDRGDATHTVLESINLPGLSLPICRDGQALIDGGLVNNIPADVLISRGCNFVIAVSVTAKIEHRFGNNHPHTPTNRMRAPSVLQTLMRSFLVQNYNLNAIGVKDADVVIEPDVTGFDLSEFTRAKDLAAVGERTAIEQLPKIKNLLSRMDPELFRFGN